MDQNSLVSASALEVSFKQLGAKQNDPLLSYPLQVPPPIHSKYTCINISSFFSVAIAQSAHAFNLKMEYVVCEKRVLLSGPLLVFFVFFVFLNEIKRHPHHLYKSRKSMPVIVGMLQ